MWRVWAVLWTLCGGLSSVGAFAQGPAGQPAAVPSGKLQAQAIGNLVVLGWEANPPQAQGRFLVERSRDGLFWQAAGQLAATSRGPAGYQFTHRLKAAYRYFRVWHEPPNQPQRLLGVTFAELDAAKVFFRAIPEADKRRLLVHYTLDRDKDVLLRMYDRIGQEVWTQRLPSGEAGVYDIEMDFSRFQRGIYLLALVQLDHDLELADVRVEY